MADDVVQRLPTETMLDVLSYCERKDFFNLACSSRSWQIVVEPRIYGAVTLSGWNFRKWKAVVRALSSQPHGKRRSHLVTYLCITNELGLHTTQSFGFTKLLPNLEVLEFRECALRRPRIHLAEHCRLRRLYLEDTVSGSSPLFMDGLQAEALEMLSVQDPWTAPDFGDQSLPNLRVLSVGCLEASDVFPETPILEKLAISSFGASPWDARHDSSRLLGITRSTPPVSLTVWMASYLENDPCIIPISETTPVHTLYVVAWSYEVADLSHQLPAARASTMRMRSASRLRNIIFVVLSNNREYELDAPLDAAWNTAVEFLNAECNSPFAISVRRSVGVLDQSDYEESQSFPQWERVRWLRRVCAAMP